LPRLHIFLDSPASNELTKTELDIGMITQPYVDIAHCIRAGFCVSHALREWVRITIGFNELDSLSLTLDPTTIRYLGTDERSILQVLLRAQESRRHKKAKVPYGVSISEVPMLEELRTNVNEETLLLIPHEKATWKKKLGESTKLAMYCPLFQPRIQNNLQASLMAFYQDQIPRDVAILELVHALDNL